MNVRNIEPGESLYVANIHAKAFRNFFLTSLGNQFLFYFYKAIITKENSIKIGLYHNGQLIGFAIGATKAKSFYKKILINNFFKLFKSAFLQLLANPNKLKRLLLSFTSSSRVDSAFENSAILLSICVDPAFSSNGYGKKLLQEFEKQAYLVNDRVYLTTDRFNNNLVNKFYIDNGYILFDTLSQGNRKMNLYYKDRKKLYI